MISKPAWQVLQSVAVGLTLAGLLHAGQSAFHPATVNWKFWVLNKSGRPAVVTLSVDDQPIPNGQVRLDAKLTGPPRHHYPGGCPSAKLKVPLAVTGRKLAVHATLGGSAQKEFAIREKTFDIEGWAKRGGAFEITVTPDDLTLSR